MKHRLPSLEALKVFEAAGRHLSFSRAAEELCITKAAVSYQIRKLETELDCALFRRAVRQVFLTDAAQELLQVTQRLFGELDTTLRQIRPVEPEHDVVIGATTYVAVRWLSPRIARFSADYPDVSILLQHTVNSGEFRIQDVDLAIRWDSLSEGARRTTLRALPMPLFPVCSPKLLARTLGSSQVTGLAANRIAEAPLNEIPLLCEERSLDLWQAWYRDQPTALKNPRRIIVDANVRTQAAIDGQGWTMADELMRAELESGALVAPFDRVLEGYGYLIQVPSGRYSNRSVLALREWLADAH